MSERSTLHDCLCSGGGEIAYIRGRIDSLHDKIDRLNRQVAGTAERINWHRRLIMGAWAAIITFGSFFVQSFIAR